MSFFAVLLFFKKLLSSSRNTTERAVRCNILPLHLATLMSYNVSVSSGACIWVFMNTKCSEAEFTVCSSTHFKIESLNGLTNGHNHSWKKKSLITSDESAYTPWWNSRNAVSGAGRRFVTHLKIHFLEAATSELEILIYPTCKLTANSDHIPVMPKKHNPVLWWIFDFVSASEWSTRKVLH